MPSPSIRPTATGPDVEEVIRFRREFGMRADRQWIAEVAANPASAEGAAVLGVPLLPDELAELLSRIREQRDVVPAILAYGRTTPEAWAGTFIDQGAGGLIVAQFSSEAETHRERLAALLPPGTPLDVREVQWSQSQLADFAAWIRSDEAWFATVGAEFRAVEIDDEGNLVRLRYRGTDSLKPVVSRHFGDPTWLHIEASPPSWSGPIGALVVEIIDPADSGQAFTCLIGTADERAPNVGQAMVADDDGRCRLDGLPAVRFHIRVMVSTDRDEDVLVGERYHFVLPNRSSVARIVVVSP